MTQLPEVLHCGHPRPEPAFVGHAGQYAVQLVDGEKRYFCRECAHKEELKQIDEGSRFVAYVSQDRKEVTNWHGAPLMKIRHCWKSRQGYCGYVYRIEAVDTRGRTWYGTSPGPGMYCRLRLAKAHHVNR